MYLDELLILYCNSIIDLFMYVCSQKQSVSFTNGIKVDNWSRDLTIKKSNLRVIIVLLNYFSF